MQYFCSLLLLFLALQCSAHSQAHLDTAKSYDYVIERTGNNDGTQVEIFLKSVGRTKGDAWCSAFVSYCLTVSGVLEPKTRSGLARDYATKTVKTLVIKASDVMLKKYKIIKGDLVVWSRGETVFGHIGMTTEDWQGIKGKTIEGNVSNKVSYMNRKIEPANYFRIKWFVKVKNETKKEKIEIDFKKYLYNNISFYNLF